MSPSPIDKQGRIICPFCGLPIVVEGQQRSNVIVIAALFIGVWVASGYVISHSRWLDETQALAKVGLFVALLVALWLFSAVSWKNRFRNKAACGCLDSEDKSSDLMKPQQSEGTDEDA